MAEAIRKVTDTTFDDDVLSSSVPVLVDFWAEWCGPCRMIAPIVDQLAADYAGRLKVAKVDTDENPAAPSRYGVRSIPTLMLFRDGRPVATKVGGAGRAELRAFLDEHLG